MVFIPPKFLLVGPTSICHEYDGDTSLLVIINYHITCISTCTLSQESHCDSCAVYILRTNREVCQGGLHCYGAPTTAALRQHSDDCAPELEPVLQNLNLCWQNLDGTTMVPAGCWSKNALGQPELAYCLSAGHLLGSAFMLQMQTRYLCMPESASVSSWALNHIFHIIMYTQCVRNLAFAIKNARKHGVYFCKSGNLCDALLGRNESPSAHSLWHSPFSALQ